MNDLIELFTYPIARIVVLLSTLSVGEITIAAIIAAAMLFIIIHRVFFGPLTG